MQKVVDAWQTQVVFSAFIFRVPFFSYFSFCFRNYQAKTTQKELSTVLNQAEALRAENSILKQELATTITLHKQAQDEVHELSNEITSVNAIAEQVS